MSGRGLFLFPALLALLASCAVPAAIGTPSTASPPQTVAPATPSSQSFTAPPAPAPSPTASPTPRPSPAAADDPLALAAQLATAERAIRDRQIGGDELAWHAHVQQLAYRRLVVRPEWREQVLDAVSGSLRPVVTANLDAGTDLRSLVTPREREALPRWRIVEPAPAEVLLGHYRAAEAEFGVPWVYLAAIHLSETRMGRIRGTSVAGAQGPMQFMPGTWAAFGEGDINDDRDAIRAAARYLRHNGAPANMANALFRYNNSQRYVRAITLYAELMRADPAAYRGYHGWQVYYLTTQGDVLLPVGYRRD